MVSFQIMLWLLVANIMTAAAKKYFPLMTKHLNELLHFGKGHNANLAMLLMRSIAADLNQGGLVDGD